jgi:hypothetical protein
MRKELRFFSSDTKGIMQQFLTSDYSVLPVGKLVSLSTGVYYSSHCRNCFL